MAITLTLSHPPNFPNWNSLEQLLLNLFTIWPRYALTFEEMDDIFENMSGSWDTLPFLLTPVYGPTTTISAQEYRELYV